MKYSFLGKAIAAGVFAISVAIEPLCFTASAQAEAPTGESYNPPPQVTANSYPPSH